MSKSINCPYCKSYPTIPIEGTIRFQCIRCGNYFKVLNNETFWCEYCNQEKPIGELASADEFICHDCRQIKLYEGLKSA